MHINMRIFAVRVLFLLCCLAINNSPWHYLHGIYNYPWSHREARCRVAAIPSGLMAHVSAYWVGGSCWDADEWAVLTAEATCVTFRLRRRWEYDHENGSRFERLCLAIGLLYYSGWWLVYVYIYIYVKYFRVTGRQAWSLMCVFCLFSFDKRW